MAGIFKKVSVINPDEQQKKSLELFSASAQKDAIDQPLQFKNTKSHTVNVAGSKDFSSANKAAGGPGDKTGKREVDDEFKIEDEIQLDDIKVESS